MRANVSLVRVWRGVVALGLALALSGRGGGVAAAPVVAPAAPAFFDGFATLDPARWHVTDSRLEGHCPVTNAGGCLPQNVAAREGYLAITVPATPAHSGGQLVSTASFGPGAFAARMRAGASQQALYAMFLFNFTTQDEIDIEITYNGVAHDGCGGGTIPASNRWEVWFTVWRGPTDPAGTPQCIAHQEVALDAPDGDHTYTLVRGAGEVRFFVDGALLFAPAVIPATGPMQLVFNAFAPVWKGPALTTDATLLVDWAAAAPFAVR